MTVSPVIVWWLLRLVRLIAKRLRHEPDPVGDQTPSGLPSERGLDANLSNGQALHHREWVIDDQRDCIVATGLTGTG